MNNNCIQKNDNIQKYNDENDDENESLYGWSVLKVY